MTSPARNEATGHAVDMTDNDPKEQNRKSLAAVPRRMGSPRTPRDNRGGHDGQTSSGGFQADFLANLSHDFRTPLTSLREFVSIVEEGLAGPITDRQRDYLRIAIRNADTLTEMMEHLFVLTQIQQGSFRLDRRKVDLAELLDDESMICGLSPRGKKVDFRCQVDECLPPVYADPDRLLQALRNLTDNAIKYSGDAVTLTVRAQKGRGPFVEVGVADNGFGMDSKTRKNLFQRAYRGSHASRRSPGGRGLGLSIVKEIVDLHGGQVLVRSNLNKGTEFRLRIPIFAPRTILTEAIERAWNRAERETGGFAFVKAPLEEHLDALTHTREKAFRQIRDLVSRTIGVGDILLPDCTGGSLICMLLFVRKEETEPAVRKIIRTLEERMSWRSGIEVEWTSKPSWIHSEDFNHLEEMVDKILHHWCCTGEKQNAS